jgi:hypothetical protein
MNTTTPNTSTDTVDIKLDCDHIYAGTRYAKGTWHRIPRAHYDALIRDGWSITVRPSAAPRTSIERATTPVVTKTSATK